MENAALERIRAKHKRDETDAKRKVKKPKRMEEEEEESDDEEDFTSW